MDDKITIADIEKDNTILRREREAKEKEIGNELILKIEQLKKQLQEEKDDRQREILLNVIQSLQNLKDEKDINAQQLIIRVAEAVRESKIARQSTNIIIKILGEERVSKLGSLKVLQETAVTIRNQDEAKRALEKQIQTIKLKNEKIESQNTKFMLIAFLIILMLGSIIAIGLLSN